MAVVAVDEKNGLHRALLKLEDGTRNGAIRLMGLLLLGARASLAAAVQDYPTRPVRFVAGYATGGSVDIMARALAQKPTDSN